MTTIFFICFQVLLLVPQRQWYYNLVGSQVKSEKRWKVSPDVDDDDIYGLEECGYCSRGQYSGCLVKKNQVTLQTSNRVI